MILSLRKLLWKLCNACRGCDNHDQYQEAMWMLPPPSRRVQRALGPSVSTPFWGSFRTAKVSSHCADLTRDKAFCCWGAEWGSGHAMTPLCIWQSPSCEIGMMDIHMVPHNGSGGCRTVSSVMDRKRIGKSQGFQQMPNCVL